MRRIFSLFVCLIFAMSIYAQDQHLTFKNIPIDGPLRTFVSKLEQQGFRLDEYSDDRTAAFLTGNFTGEEATIIVVTTPSTKKVCRVAVFFPKKKSWHSLKSDYFEYKKMYIQKYGKPKDEYEFFVKPYYEGDGYELQALRKENCYYSTFFYINDGIITVRLTNTCHLSIVYEDKVNNSLFTAEKDKNNLNDI